MTGDTLAFNGGTNTESFVDGSTITGSFNGTTLTLTVGAGNPTAADFQAALQSVTFNNTSLDVSASNPGSTRTLDWTVTTVRCVQRHDPQHCRAADSAIERCFQLPAGHDVPACDADRELAPGGTSGVGTPGVGTLVSGTSGTSGIVTLGTSTSGPGTFSGTSGAGTFDPTLFGIGAGGPGYFDPDGGFGSGLDFSTTFTTASTDVPATSEAPLTLVADGSLGFGFDQKTDQNADKGNGDATPAPPEKAIAVAEKDAASPDPVPVPGRFVPADTAPVAGKVALSAQLRAAGRHGFLHDRLALLKSLRDGVRG